jgi:hypothetical protein
MSVGAHGGNGEQFRKARLKARLGEYNVKSREIVHKRLLFVGVQLNQRDGVPMETARSTWREAVARTGVVAGQTRRDAARNAVGNRERCEQETGDDERRREEVWRRLGACTMAASKNRSRKR